MTFVLRVIVILVDVQFDEFRERELRFPRWEDEGEESGRGRFEG